MSAPREARAYPHGDLPRNVLAFCEVLRREHGFRLGPGESVDALRALELVPLADGEAVRVALRLLCCASPSERAVFDRAFAEFFLPGPEGIAQRRQPAQASREEAGPDEGGESAGVPRRDAPPPGDDEGPLDGSTRVPSDDDPGAPEGAAAELRALASPDAGATEDASVPGEDAAAMVEATAHLLARLRRGRSRRHRPLPRGTRFDIRRTLRDSLATGGEPLRPRFLGRPPGSARVTLIVDGSRSMAPYAGAALQLAAALVQLSPSAEVYAFSTEVRRLTPALRELGPGRGDATLARLAHAWGGGTRIGESIAAILRDRSLRLGPRSVVLICSDGLEVGDAAVLRDAMRTLRRRAARVIWLNPLLGLQGYEPSQAGMRAARDSVDTFARFADAADVARLARALPGR